LQTDLGIFFKVSFIVGGDLPAKDHKSWWFKRYHYSTACLQRPPLIIEFNCYSQQILLCKALARIASYNVAKLDKHDTSELYKW